MANYTSKRMDLRSGRTGPEGALTIDRNAGPWAPIATVIHAIERIRTERSPRVDKFAAEIVQGATTEEEKARRIHRKVQELYLRFRQLPRRAMPNLAAVARGDAAQFVERPDETLDFERKEGPIIEDMEFFWLAVAMFRAAGLETRTVLLPNRNLVQFDRERVAAIFLPNICAMVRVDGAWRFSHPLAVQPVNFNNTRMLAARTATAPVLPPFGMLPARHEGQVGLVVQANKEEFIPIPFTPAEKSLIANVGLFSLGLDGALSGEGLRRYTGHTALALRASLLNEPAERRNEIVTRSLRTTLKTPEISVTQLTGIEDADAPIEVRYNVTWPGFAVVTKDRLIFRPELFRIETDAPFSAVTRRHPVHFPTPWQEADRIRIQLPEGFHPETLQAPASYAGNVLHHRATYGFEVPRRTLIVNRDFSSSVSDVAPESYADLKGWYDRVHASDQHELVFRLRDAAPGTPAAGAETGAGKL